MKVSKVVLIVVALHVVVIGGIFIFEGCSRSKTGTPDMAANETLPGQEPDAVASIPQTMQPSMIPAPVTAAQPDLTTAPQQTSRAYTVKKGDSLWKIAKSEGISIGDLARANNLTKTSTLRIGQKLQIPQATKSTVISTATASVVPTGADMGGATIAATSMPTDGNGPVYTVKSGDSLWKIARQNGVSVASIKQANSMTSDMLKIGQQIRIPTVSTTAAATTAGTEWTGTAPTVNAGIATASTAAWRDPGTYTENGQTIHIVDFNESPAVIAKKYGIKTEDLLRANNITDARRIEYGQRLVIPVQGSSAMPTTPVSMAPATGTPSVGAALAAPVVSASRTMAQ